MIKTLAKSGLTPTHIDAFRAIAGDKYVFIDEESLHHYAHDETGMD